MSNEEIFNIFKNLYGKYEIKLIGDGTRKQTKIILNLNKENDLYNIFIIENNKAIGLYYDLLLKTAVKIFETLII